MPADTTARSLSDRDAFLKVQASARFVPHPFDSALRVLVVETNGQPFRTTFIRPRVYTLDHALALANAAQEDSRARSNASGERGMVREHRAFSAWCAALYGKVYEDSRACAA